MNHFVLFVFNVQNGKKSGKMDFIKLGLPSDWLKDKPFAI